MSHILQIQTEVKDPAAIAAACQRLKLTLPREGAATLFNTEVRGWLVDLPDWLYPVVCDIGTGQIKYDNYGGSWGERAHLDRWLQAYAVEKAHIEARRNGLTATERLLVDGSIQVTIQLVEES